MLAKKRKIKKSGSFQNRFSLILTIIIFVCLVGFLAFSNFRINQRRSEMQERIDGLTREVDFLTERNKQLESGIFRAEEESYWEARLYEQGYRKPGEESIIIIPPKETEEGEETTVSAEKAFLENLLDLILGR